MGYLECELSKVLVRIRLFEKSCPYLKKLQFSLWSVSKQFFWYCEILNFSGFSGLEPMLWVMWNVNFQKVWSEYVYLKKNCPYLKKLQFSLWSVSNVFRYCEILLFSCNFGSGPVVWDMWTANPQKNGQNAFIWKKFSLFKKVAIFSIICFKIGFIGIVKYCSFPAFLV